VALAQATIGRFSCLLRCIDMQTLGRIISSVFRRIVPDPLVIAILLTIGVFIAAMVWGTFPDTCEGPADRLDWLVASWGSDAGLWKLLAFAMQMCLILLGGYLLAEAPPIRRLLETIASLPRSGRSAAGLVGLVAMLLGVLNWGLGLIGGALLARAAGRSLARRNLAVHYPLLAAAGYTGLLVWQGGFSGSAPLSMTTATGAQKVLPDAADIAASLAPLDTTILAARNLIVTGGLIALVPLLLMLLHPVRSAAQPLPAHACEPTHDSGRPPIETPADWLNHAPWVNRILGVLVLIAAVSATRASGIDRMGLNTVIMFMLGAALLLHRSPVDLMRAAATAAAGCAGIIIQFPLYAGIMGLMVASGLAQQMTETMLELASPGTLEFWTMVSAGFVNLLVPSGGGQWAVQGPMALQAASESGIGTGSIIMAVAYGDELTNMLQPFWALPLLAITGVRARDIVGYTTIIMLFAGGWMTLWLLLP